MSKQALDGTRVNAFAMAPEALTIVEDRNHALYDPRVERGLTEEFIASIERYGVKTPVTVQKDGGDVLVVWGRRRVRGARIVNERRKKAGLPPMLVTCMVFRGDEREAFALSILENEHREDDGPLEKAHKLARLLGMGYAEKEAALIFGLGLTAIRNLRTLIDMSSEVKARVEKGQMSASAAVQLAHLPRAEQAAKAGELVAAGAVSKVRVARAVAGTRSSADGRLVTIAKGRLRRIAKLNEREKTLPGNVRAFLDWILGEIADDEVRLEVKGMETLFKAEAEEPVEKAEVGA